MKKNNKIEIAFIIIQGIAKSFWNATTKVVWGIAGIFLLAGLIVGMDVDASKISGLLEMSLFVIRNWLIFWFIFFVSNLYFELRGELYDRW